MPEKRLESLKEFEQGIVNPASDRVSLAGDRVSQTVKKVAPTEQLPSAAISEAGNEPLPSIQ